MISDKIINQDIHFSLYHRKMLTVKFLCIIIFINLCAAEEYVETTENHQHEENYDSKENHESDEIYGNKENHESDENYENKKKHESDETQLRHPRTY